MGAGTLITTVMMWVLGFVEPANAMNDKDQMDHFGKIYKDN